MLKTDYKEDVFEGNRKYQLSQDSDGKTEILDVTTYTQEGDPFGASDINATNTAINSLLGEPVYVTFLESAWTGTEPPYTQTVAVDGVTAEDNPMLVSALKDNATVEEHRAYNKAFGIIAAGIGDTGNGSVIYKVFKKPEIDITVGLRGVGANG